MKRVIEVVALFMGLLLRATFLIIAFIIMIILLILEIIFLPLTH